MKLTIYAKLKVLSFISITIFESNLLSCIEREATKPYSAKSPPLISNLTVKNCPGRVNTTFINPSKCAV